jgi:hypothetical protein
MMLETYTTMKGDDLHLPDFLEISREVTDDPGYSMYNLSLKDHPVTTDHAKISTGGSMVNGDVKSLPSVMMNGDIKSDGVKKSVEVFGGAGDKA